MMVQSTAGLQLDALKKKFVDIIIPMNKVPTPKIVQCFGYKFSDFMLNLSKNYF
jgi:hypothetical protein